MRTLILYIAFLVLDDGHMATLAEDNMWEIAITWCVCWDVLSWIRGTI